ncbi:unnamed protein product [Pieris macdunnoughi]|uniref:Elongation of very long chain fatty acids protein n=1 Tax=Pieris macdunnoughi TaxID=345717 RepID=A0A821LP02_9NEOP|nr:unnamed protein product [Pieris macdunnoughi]
MDTIISAYKYIDEELASPITKDWFLASSIWRVLGIILVYNIFARKLGPYLMRNREPYDLKNIIQLYNISQVVASAYLVYQGYFFFFVNEYNLLCQGVDDSDSETSVWIARNVYIYYMLKYIELLDTVFFILRKSFRQVSPLHLHHHSLMPIVSWIAVRYVPGGQCVMIGFINSFVHIIMYGYYFVAGLGPQYKKYLWWKKYVTVLQLIQFTLVGVHSVVSMFFPCSYPVIFKLLTIGYACIFMNMFGQFYYNSYVKRKPETANGSKRK